MPALETAMVAPQVATAQAAQPPSPRIRAGTTVRPETVTVADPFVFAVTVEVPRDARIEWPTIEDSTALVSQRAPVTVRDVGEGPTRQETARYVLAAWDTGAVPIGLPDAVVRVGENTLRIPLSGSVYVRSVLPGDTTQHVPKPAKDLFPRAVPWWEQWWLAALVLLALALLYWLLRRRKKVAAARPAPHVDIYARAMHDFERLDRLALADAGERGRYVALAVEVLRTYLVGRVPAATMSLTSSELITAVRDDTRVPITRLAPLIGEADAIKFARYPIDTARARALAAESRGIVEDIEHAVQARIAALAAEREAAAKAEQLSRSRGEDEARRRSRKGAA